MRGRQETVEVVVVCRSRNQSTHRSWWFRDSFRHRLLYSSCIWLLLVAAVLEVEVVLDAAAVRYGLRGSACKLPELWVQVDTSGLGAADATILLELGTTS